MNSSAHNPQSYPFAVEVEVIFRDLDAMGHVNNAVYFTYMETARTKFFAQLLRLDRPSDLPVILAEASCTFKSPAFFGEQLSIDLAVSRLGSKSFDLDFRIWAGDGRLVATGKSVMVTYDYGSGRTIPIPDDLNARLQSYLLPETPG